MRPSLWGRPPGLRGTPSSRGTGADQGVGRRPGGLPHYSQLWTPLLAVAAGCIAEFSRHRAATEGSGGFSRRPRRQPYCVALFFLATALHAAEIRGTVVENQTGHPLARATVSIQNTGNGRETRLLTNVNGIFDFGGLAAGAYIVSANQLAFAPVQYGQKRWHSRGKPIELTPSDTVTITIRMPRYGSITGTLQDENDVGLPEQEVAVYTDTHPPKLVVHEPTDLRGVYRLAGLRPGNYLVRSLAKTYDDGGYLPTFYPDSMTASDARPIQVTLDQEQERVDFHARPGRLFSVSGRIVGLRWQTSITLFSDTGSEGAAVGAAGNFTFLPMAPGTYELLVVTEADRNRPRTAYFRDLVVDRNLTDVTVGFFPLPTVQFRFEDTAGHQLTAPDLAVMMHRKTPASEPSETQLVGADGAEVVPGRWEMALAPNVSYCAVGFEPQDSVRADSWHEILLASGQHLVKFVLSVSPASISGTVKGANGQASAGVTVWVQSDDHGPMHSTNTDARGQYSIGGLAPGGYRVLASADYQLGADPDMQAPLAQTVKLEEGSRAVADLAEFMIG